MNRERERRRRARVAVYDRPGAQGDWLSLFAPQSVDIVRAESLKALAESLAEHAVAWVTPAEAATLAGELAAHPSAPPVTMMTGASASEHPQTRLMKALVIAKREWEATFDAILDPIAILDKAGLVLRANLGFARAVGRDVRDLVSRPYGSLLGLPEPEASNPIARSLADGGARTEEARYPALPNIQQVTVSPLAEEDGSPGALVVILKDLGQQKEQQQRLQQAGRLAEIGQLAAGVAHEINTPLASIALRAESLLRLVEEPSLVASPSFKNFPRYLKTIEEETFRCKKIIRSLLEFSSSRKPETRPTDLNTLAERAADLVGHQMKLKHVSLSLRLDRELAPIPADEGQIRQVMISLLMNALDASVPGGHIEVATARSGEGRVALIVTDEGAGIAPEVRDKIFSPFFTTKPFGEGTGLGLAVCHGIVAAHGGEIEVTSGPGAGTRISVLLPAQGPHEATAR